jgi:hypothetical protein
LPAVGFPDTFIVEAETNQSLGAYVGHQHIGLLRQRQRGSLALRRLEIEYDAALVAVRIQEHGAHAGMAPRADPSHRIAGRRLDLHHVGSEIAQHLRRGGAHHDRRQVEYTHPLQRSGGTLRRELPHLRSLRRHVVVLTGSSDTSATLQ